MTPRELDDRLAETISTLPRASASADFTARVLTALHEREPVTVGRRRIAGWAAAVAVALLALGIGGSLAVRRHQAAEAAYRQQVQELRSEYQRLLAEVAQVRQQATEPPARLYLGGDEQVDLVVDLSEPMPLGASRLSLPADRSPEKGSGKTRPANWDQ